MRDVTSRWCLSKGEGGVGLEAVPTELGEGLKGSLGKPREGGRQNSGNPPGKKVAGPRQVEVSEVGAEGFMKSSG